MSTGTPIDERNLPEIGYVSIRDDFLKALRLPILAGRGLTADDAKATVMDIISSIPGMEEVVGLVRSSHERWDGRGYPDGLQGNEVPRGAYVIAACDAYHAMTEDRVYRKAMSIELACQELRRCSGSQFMPAAVDALIAVVERGEALRRVVYQSQAA